MEHDGMLSDMTPSNGDIGKCTASALASLRVDHSRGSRGTQRTSTAILSAAASLLERRRFHELRVTEIIDAARVSRPTFYSYFAGKADVLAALNLQVLDELTRAAEDLHDRPLDQHPRDAIAQATQRLVAVWGTHRAVLNATVENRHAIPEIQQASAEILKTLVGRISRQIDRDRLMGFAPQGPPSEPLVRALLGSTEQILYQSAGQGSCEVPGRNNAASVLTALWVGTLYAQPDTSSPS